jgi:hypothetical protein
VTGEPETTDVQEIDESLKAALKLDGLPDALIESMLKSDRDGLIAYALSAGKRQKNVNQAYQERAELKKSADASTENEPEAIEPAQPTLDAQALAQPLIDELGEEAAGAVVKMLEAQLQPLREQLQASKDAQVTARDQQEQAALTSARHGLEGRFPQVKDATAYAKLMERVTRMAPGYTQNEGSLEAVVVELMTDAARLEFGQEVAPAKTPRKQSRNQPTSPTRKVSPKTQNQDEKDWDIFSEIEAKHGY